MFSSRKFFRITTIVCSRCESLFVSIQYEVRSRNVALYQYEMRLASRTFFCFNTNRGSRQENAFVSIRWDFRGMNILSYPYRVRFATRIRFCINTERLSWQIHPFVSLQLKIPEKFSTTNSKIRSFLRFLLLNRDNVIRKALFLYSLALR